MVVFLTFFAGLVLGGCGEITEHEPEQVVHKAASADKSGVIKRATEDRSPLRLQWQMRDLQDLSQVDEGRMQQMAPPPREPAPEPIDVCVETLLPRQLPRAARDYPAQKHILGRVSGRQGGRRIMRFHLGPVVLLDPELARFPQDVIIGTLQVYSDEGRLVAEYPLNTELPMRNVPVGIWVVTIESWTMNFPHYWRDTVREDIDIEIQQAHFDDGTSAVPEEFLEITFSGDDFPKPRLRIQPIRRDVRATLGQGVWPLVYGVRLTNLHEGRRTLRFTQGASQIQDDHQDLLGLEVGAEPRALTGRCQLRINGAITGSAHSHDADFSSHRIVLNFPVGFEILPQETAEVLVYCEPLGEPDMTCRELPWDDEPAPEECGLDDRQQAYTMVQLEAAWVDTDGRGRQVQCHEWDCALYAMIERARMRSHILHWTPAAP